MEEEEVDPEEERAYFRRRVLRALRGHLRQNRQVRWSLLSVQVGCALLAYLAASWLVGPLGKAWPLAPGLGVIVVWPVYVLSLRVLAGNEMRERSLMDSWEVLKKIDEEGELEDLSFTKRANDFIDRVYSWFPSDGTRWRFDGGIFVITTLLTVISAGPWFLWELLRMGPELLAEMILDGGLAPVYPEIREQLPVADPWYKTALVKTFLHFVALGFIAIVAEVLVKWWPWLWSH